MDGQTKFKLIDDFDFDMNKLYNSNSIGIVRNFVSEHDIMVCDNLDGNKLGYTYWNEGLNDKLLIDQVFITSFILNRVNKYMAHDSGLNFSDHCLISFNLIVNPVSPDDGNYGCNVNSTSNCEQNNYVWDSEDCLSYNASVTDKLHACDCPHLLLKFSFPCSNVEHSCLINKFSDYLASILVDTASCVVKHKTHCYKTI